ncbi:unnamed protein product [Adineta ricciae]|uniref:Uncharacterized protein n=1 Tax=Adineta ricciae TaxID=249248 RepID=A0A814SXE9_ADIRI|nr:unnamed protein product [Adineta ricciae]CAF1153371.1 unnamed protein product [Adineta ricciae]
MEDVVCFALLMLLLRSKIEQSSMLHVNKGQRAPTGDYGTFYGVYVVICMSAIPATTITIFVCLTYRNLKHVPTRIQPTSQEPTGRLK